MDKDDHHYEEIRHCDMPHIGDSSNYSLPKKKEESYYAELNLNLKKSPICINSFEWIKQNRKTSILLGALVLFAILALVGVAIASK